MKIRSALPAATTAALFALPTLFFIVVYFLQSVSSEDIYQGAGQSPAVIHDAIAAFHWSARFGDMYAWSVINFFDYTYRFGIDTIFRALDVILAIGIFLIMTRLILDRRPRFEVKDTLIFCLSFLAVFLSDYSRSLISGFSHIHNYLLLTIFSLLFLLPFVYQLRGATIAPRPRMKLLMFVVGFLFAFSSNVTPVVFLMTTGLVVLYNRIALKRTIDFDKILRSWQIFAVAGILLAMLVMYVFGPGVSSYTHGYNSSYVSIANLIASPAASGVALLGNMAHNFRSVSPAILMMIFAALVEYIIARKKLIPKRRESVDGVKFSVVALLFFILHVFAVSQIDITGMTRILIPAYICVVVSVLFTVNRLFMIGNIKQGLLMMTAMPLLLLTSIITVDIGIMMVRHQQQENVVLERIKRSKSKDACVTRADNPTVKSPVLKYYQRELFVDWAMPATIYDKQVNWCK